MWKLTLGKRRWRLFETPGNLSKFHLRMVHMGKTVIRTWLHRLAVSRVQNRSQWSDSSFTYADFNLLPPIYSPSSFSVNNGVDPFFVVVFQPYVWFKNKSGACSFVNNEVTASVFLQQLPISFYSADTEFLLNVKIISFFFKKKGFKKKGWWQKSHIPWA